MPCRSKRKVPGRYGWCMASTLVLIIVGWIIGQAGRPPLGGPLEKVPDREIFSPPALAPARVAHSPAGLLPREGAPGISHGSRPPQEARIASIGDAPAWAITYGQEFWRSVNPVASLPRTGQGAAIGAIPACLNVGEVMDRVMYAFASPDASSRTRVDARTYQATLDGSGLTDLTLPASLEGGEVQFYQFAVPVGVLAMEVRLENRVTPSPMTVY